MLFTYNSNDASIELACFKQKRIYISQDYEAMSTHKLFYGWTIVALAVVGLATGWAAIGVFSFGAFIKPLELEFGWQRGEISLTLAVINLTGIVMTPVIGFLVDKHGVRKILLPSTLLLGSLTASLYFLTGNLWHFYLVWFLVIFFGCAASPLSYSKLIVKWFDKRRGIALGIGLAGVGLGAALMPPLAQSLISEYGWRIAYLGLACSVLIISLPLLVLLLRNTPEEMGLSPDGSTFSVEDNHKTSVTGFTLHETLRQKSFWLMAVVFMLIGMAVVSIIVHLIPMLIERGISPAEAAKAQGFLGLSLIFGRIFAGYLMDRFFAPRVALVFFIGPVIGISMLAMGMSGAMLYFAIVLIGMAIGAEFDVMGYLTSRYSGLLNYGQTFGLLFAAFEIGAAIGPTLMGYCFDLTGEYTIVLWAMAALALLACVLTSRLGPYPTLPEAN